MKQVTEDPLLQNVMAAISDDHWNDQQLSRFVPFIDKLSTHDGFHASSPPSCDTFHTTEENT